MTGSLPAPSAPTVRAPGPVCPSGFTLIELIVTLAVAAILLALAAPSLVRVIQGARMAGELSSFASDLHYARSEAVRQGVNVSMCPSTTGTTCTGGVNWQAGWVVFSDPDASRSLEDGELILRRQQAWSGGDALESPSSTTAVLSFSRDGFAIGLPGSAVFSLRSPTLDATLTRCVTLSLAGKQRTIRADGQICT